MTIQKQQQEQKDPLMKMEITYQNPLILMLNRDQKNYLIKFTQLLSNLDIIQDNYHFRPEVPVRKNGPEWWKYAIMAIVERQKKFKLDLNFGCSRIVLMKRYIMLYKRKQNIIHVPWLAQFTSQDELRFQYCERVLPLKDLLKYREWAFTEIHLEAKRYFNSSKDGSDGKSVKPLLEIWTNTINNENAFADKLKGDSDDVPVELQDFEKINLYEVLERDQAQVLNSYLQGVNNSPDQTEMHIELTISSVFILLLEEKQDQQILYSPKNLRIYNGCKCEVCARNAFNHRPRSFSATSDSQAPRRFQPRQKQSNHQRPKLFTNLNQKQSEKQDGDDSFCTAKGDDEKKDSFLSDLDDLNDNGIPFAVQVENQQLDSSFQKLQGTDVHKASRCQRLFLIIEAKHIRASVLKFRDNRILTLSMKDQNEGGFMISDIRVMSPGYLSKYLCDEAQQPLEQQQEEKEKVKQMRSKLKRKWIDFLLEIFDIAITKDPIFYNSDTNFKYFMEFLNTNEMKHFADFLEKYEKDKNYFQDFLDSDFQKYDQFFDPNSENYLHLSDESQEKFKQYQLFKTGFHYASLLEELHSRVVEQIKRYVFPVFLAEYGEWILPICIEHLKSKGDYHIDKQWHKELKKVANLRVDFCLQGKQPEFQIVPTQKQMKKASTKDVNRQGDKIEQNASEQEAQMKSQSTMTIHLSDLKVYLTSHTLKSLVNYFGNDSNQESPEYTTVQENKLLLECIMKSQNLTENELEPPLNLKVLLPNRIKVIVLCDSLYNLNRSEIKLQVTELYLMSLGKDDYKAFDAAHPHLKVHSTLLLRNRYYQQQLIRLGELSVSHKFPKRTQAANNEAQPILKLNMNALIVSSLIPNHAALTDTKLFIQIPSFKLEITSEITGFLEVLQILSFQSSQPQGNEKKKPYRLFSPYGYHQREDPILLAELSALYQDHKVNNKSCRHCVIKYRKSSALTNLVFGDMRHMLGQSNAKEATWLHILQEEINSGPVQPGIEFSFKNSSRSHIAVYQENYTKLILNLVIITLDKGFFKSNITIHCTEANVENVVRPPNLKLGPLIQKNLPNIFAASKRQSAVHQPQSETSMVTMIPLTTRRADTLLYLDTRHVFYCKQLQGEIFQRPIMEMKQAEKQQQPVENLGNDQFAKEVVVTDKNQLYLLAYVHQPLRQEILEVVEKQTNERNKKTQLYFRLREISIKYSQPHSACVIPLIFQNINFVLKYLTNAWQVIYGKQNESNEKPPVTQSDFSGKSNPLKQLDDMMFLFSINLIQYFTNIKSELNQSILLQIKDLVIEYNLDLADLQPDALGQPVRLFSSINPRAFINLSDLNRQNTINPNQSPVPILHCQEIQLNFSGIGHINIQSIALQRIENRISFQVTKVLVRNLWETLIVIPHQTNQINPKALNVIVDFITGLIDVAVDIDSVQITVSKENIQEFLLSLNTIFLILLQEFREFKTFIKKEVFYPIYQKFGSNYIEDLFKFHKVDVEEAQQQQNSQSVQLHLRLGYLNMVFNKDKKAFSRLYLSGLTIEPKKSDMEIRVEEIGFYPHREQGGEVNLVSPHDGEGQVHIRVVSRRSELLVEVENLNFCLISRYLNELNGFVSEITSELAKSKENILGGLKKPKKRQVMDELEKMIQKQVPLNVQLRNSSITMPESSTSTNFVKVYFKHAEIAKTCQKISINVPGPVAATDRLENMIIDYREEMSIHQAHMSILTASLHDVEVTYLLKRVKDRIHANVHSPLQSPLMFQLWEYKTTVHADIHNLDLKMDMGKLQVIGDLANSNTTEKSELFHFDPPTLDKVNIHLGIKSMRLRQQKFIYQEEDESAYRESDEDESSDDYS